jgi:hypothetical protein
MCGVALSCGYWYWAFGTGPVAWALAVVRAVKRLLSPLTNIMSRSENTPTVEALSSKDGQPDGRTDTDPIGRTELLTLYKVLRKYGVPREEIRPALKGVRVPLSNDVWAAAPANTNDAHVTPIAHPTRAVFEQDPDRSIAT